MSSCEYRLDCSFGTYTKAYSMELCKEWRPNYSFYPFVEQAHTRIGSNEDWSTYLSCTRDAKTNASTIKTQLFVHISLAVVPFSFIHISNTELQHRAYIRCWSSSAFFCMPLCLALAVISSMIWPSVYGRTNCARHAIFRLRPKNSIFIPMTH